jgi:hypothetical protein
MLSAATGMIPGVGALYDALSGSGNDQSANAQNSPITYSTAGQAMPRTTALLLRRYGINAIPPGADVNSFLDNIVYKALGGQ